MRFSSIVFNFIYDNYLGKEFLKPKKNPKIIFTNYAVILLSLTFKKESYMSLITLSHPKNPKKPKKPNFSKVLYESLFMK